MGNGFGLCDFQDIWKRDSLRAQISKSFYKLAQKKDSTFARIPIPRSKQSLAKHNSLGIAMSNELAYIRHIFKTNNGESSPKPQTIHKLLREGF